MGEGERGGGGERESVCVGGRGRCEVGGVWKCVCVEVSVCVYMCIKEREGEGERDRESACVSVFKRDRKKIYCRGFMGSSSPR